MRRGGGGERVQYEEGEKCDKTVNKKQSNEKQSYLTTTKPITPIEINFRYVTGGIPGGVTFSV